MSTTHKSYWKVVQNINGKLYSSISSHSDNTKLQYKLGEETVPKIGKIFIFENYQNAKRFLEIIWNNTYKTSYSILIVDAKNITNETFTNKKSVLSTVFLNCHDDVLEFWNKIASKDTTLIEIDFFCDKFCVTVPTGTLLASSVTPTSIYYTKTIDGKDIYAENHNEIG